MKSDSILITEPELPVTNPFLGKLNNNHNNKSPPKEKNCKTVVLLSLFQVSHIQTHTDLTTVKYLVWVKRQRGQNQEENPLRSREKERKNLYIA